MNTTFFLMISLYRIRASAALYLLCVLFGVVTPIAAYAQPEVVDRIATVDDSASQPVRLRALADRLEHPWAVAPLPGGGALISERPGRLWYLTSLEPGTGAFVAVSDLPDIYAERQGGLLDVIVDPQFARNSRVYVSYSVRAGRGSTTRVARARFVRGGGRARLDDLEVLFTLNTELSGSRHYGSRLVFDGDGYLYITIGDRGDPPSAQDLANHQGSLVRIASDGSVPHDNPFAAGRGPEQPEIFSFGHRNAQGIALHRPTGRVWLHEHGPRGGDEINIISAGANYGWPRMTGGVAYSGAVIAESPPPRGMEAPLLEWTPSIAPSGMSFVEDERYGA